MSTDSLEAMQKTLGPSITEYYTVAPLVKGRGQLQLSNAPSPSLDGVATIP